jgi:SAM-dependent methyltransferase
LLRWAEHQPVIGLDRTFFVLYVAKNWLAPTADYVCADADVGLPFSDATFSAAICSDAFHYFANKATCVRELKRLTQHDGFIALATIRNALIKHPHYTYGSLPPDAGQTLVADMPHRLLANSGILARYLEKQGPALAHPTDMGRLASEPWLSVVASHRQELLQDYGSFEDWPHAAGRLELNPLYQQDREDGFGNVRLRHTFPSPWYAEENGECRQYEPETLTVSSKALADMAEGKRTMEIERLIEKCVMVGMPERFR